MKERALERCQQPVVSSQVSAGTAVHRITHDRMADAVEMYPNLMCAARGDGDSGQGQTTKSFCAGHARDCGPSSSGPCRHLLAVRRVPAERGIDTASGVQ